MAFANPKLNYDLGALAPIMTKEQVDLHFNKHTLKYFEETNKLIKGTQYESMTCLDDLVIPSKLGSMDSKLFNAACQAWNHVFFWNCLAPKGKTGEMSDELKAAIEDEFRSVAEFKRRFIEIAGKQFGSGWGWLVKDGDRLMIRSTPNARNPRSDQSFTPLLTIDVWEHAYYVDHPADRKTYLEDIWDIINWKFVNEQFTKASK